MKFAITALAFAAALALALPAGAAAPITQTTEKVKLAGKKGPSLFKPGYQLAEYEGYSSVRTTKSSVLGIFESDKASVELTVNRPGLGPVAIACGGGQSRLGLGWITFDRDKLQYVCTISGPGAGEDAAFGLAWARGSSFLKSLQQPQRAGELRFGGVSVRVQTEQVGSMPTAGGGAVIGYVFSRDGVDIGAVNLNRMTSIGLGTAYLPTKPGPDRDAVAVLSLILMFFQDPGRQR
jgi:hypothetical protein